MEPVSGNQALPVGATLSEENQCDCDIGNQISRSVNVSPNLWKTASMNNKAYKIGNRYTFVNFGLLIMSTCFRGI